MTGDENREFRIDFTVQARIDLVSLLQRAVGRPAFVEIEAAYLRVQERLRTSARSIGDPLYHLRAMKMTVMSLTEPPLYIGFGVHDEEPVVVVRAIRMIR